MDWTQIILAVIGACVTICTIVLPIVLSRSQKKNRTVSSSEIDRLKSELAGSDYKVAKCYEASLVGEELPYDIAALHVERQAVRTRINELEGIIFLPQDA